MAKVIFTISYDVNPEKRDEYLALMQEVKQHFAASNGKEYSVYEQKGKKNSFSEVFVFNSVEAYDQLEDQDESMSAFVQRLETLLVDGKMHYTTLVELE
jgi:quinol monooxygenase YgiN